MSALLLRAPATKHAGNSVKQGVVMGPAYTFRRSSPVDESAT